MEHKLTDIVLPETLESSIADVIDHWDDPQSDERKRFEEARASFGEKAAEITEAAAATERLNASDFAFCIHSTQR